MTKLNYLSHNQDETINLGVKIAARVKPGDIICLFGELGTGKTTFVKGLAEGLKIKSRQVHSPTFVLLNIYEGRLPLFHFDLYRLGDPCEIAQLGHEEYFYDNGVAVIEWAERLKQFMPEDYLAVRLEHQGEDLRAVELEAVGERSRHLLDKLKGIFNANVRESNTDLRE
jgi:tRNA threonylcarbamoyladenosine biosynthesis protein TsaE